MIRSFSWRTPLFGLAVGLLLVGAAACESDDEAATEWSDVEDIRRDVLGEATMEQAPGQILELSRVIIPAGQSIDPHTHPGTQMAVILQGTLTYTIISGEVTVTRDAGTGDEREERFGAGETTDIEPGDSLVEPKGMEHEAENRGDEPVVISLASLFETGAPASSPLETGADTGN